MKEDVYMAIVVDRPEGYTLIFHGPGGIEKVVDEFRAAVDDSGSRLLYVEDAVMENVCQ